MDFHAYRLSSGVSCAIAPALGCNLVSWVVDGREVFHRHPDLGRDPQRFFYGGNPVLFPAVGRCWERSGPAPRFGIYRIYGREREYFMPLHGLLAQAECCRTAEDVEPQRVHVRYEVRIPAAVRLASYPFDVGLTLEYTIADNSLLLEAAVANHGDSVAPFALGYHPWFATGDPGRRGVSVHLPCTVERTLHPELVIPDGGRRAFAGTLEFGPAGDYGGVYAGLTGRRATLTDTVAGRSIHVDIDENIAEFVIASPDKTPAVCVEPWTAGLGGYETLAAADWESLPTVEQIQPGEVRHIRIRYTVEK